MDSDKLKSFIKEHREEFDVLTPTDKLWEKIDADLPESRRMVPIRQLYYACAGVAAAVVLLAAAFWNINQSNSDQVADVSVSNQSEIELLSLSDVSSELAEVESYYVAEVNLKMDELKELDNSGEYLAEVEMLREEFDELRKEMGRGADQEKIVQAMIQNYRLRLEILEEMLDELRSWKRTENGSYEA